MYRYSKISAAQYNVKLFCLFAMLTCQNKLTVWLAADILGHQCVEILITIPIL